ICFLFVFFFQAEDGIRDLTVTGVQTCALPICPKEHLMPRILVIDDQSDVRAMISMVLRINQFEVMEAPSAAAGLKAFEEAEFDRSEERRVGKECRWRWLADH